MITIVFRMVIKRDRLVEFKEMVKTMTNSTLKEDAGCLFYEFFRGTKLSNEYLLYEKWKDKDSLDRHLNRLRKLFGPAEQDSILSKKLNDCFTETEDVYYMDQEKS